MAPLLSFSQDRLSAALRAVTANHEENVDLASYQVVHRDTDVYRSARGIQLGAAFLVNILDELGSKRDRFGAAPRIKPLIATNESEDLAYAITVMKFQNERTDDVIQSGAQAAAGDDACTRVLRIEEKALARAGNFEQKLLRHGNVGVDDDV